MYFIAKRLRKIRIERRKAKNQKSALWPLRDFFSKNPQIKNGIIKTQGDVKKNIRQVESQTYIPRVINESEFNS